MTLAPSVKAAGVRMLPWTEDPAPMDTAPMASMLPRTTTLAATEKAAEVREDPVRVDAAETLTAPRQAET